MSAAGHHSTEWRRFWPLPFAAALGYSSSVLHVYSLGPFIEPLQREFAWSRAEVSLGITIANIGVAIFCAPIGLLVDRFGPRTIGLIGTLLITMAYALLGTANGTITNWVALWSIVALGALCVQSPVWTSAVATRFERSRGLAFAVTLSGASIGVAVFPALGTWLIGAYGWRAAFAGMGTLWAAIVIPILLMFFRGAQDTRGKAQAAQRPDQTSFPGLTWPEGIRTPAFYKLLLAGGLFAFTTIGVVVHFVPILTDSGATRLSAAAVASLVGIFAIVGRLGTGLLLDRLPGRYVGACAFVVAIMAYALLLYGDRVVSPSVAAVIIGLTLGAEVDVIAYLATRHFGLKNFGALFGGLVAALALGAAFGPLGAGATFDHYGTYAPFLTLAMVLMGISSVLMASLGAPPFGTARPGLTGR